MVNIPPPPIPSTAPESLTIETSLSSVMAINSIFKDQIQFYAQFGDIVVSAPFRLVDNDSFKKAVFAADQTRPLIVDEIKEIHKYATGNIHCYETKIEPKIEAKRLLGTIDRYYTIHPTGAMAALPAAKDWILHPDNQQRQRFMFFTLHYFCKEIHKITSRFLAEPLVAIQSAPITLTEINIDQRISQYLSLELKGDQPTAQVKAEPQPKQHKDNITAAQQGLFLYYLAEGKHISRPVAGDFRIKNFHQKEPYNFNKSGNTVYLFFIHPKITKPNLAVIIPMLEKYPAGKMLAQKDEYSLNIE